MHRHIKNIIGSVKHLLGFISAFSEYTSSVWQTIPVVVVVVVV